MKKDAFPELAMPLFTMLLYIGCVPASGFPSLTEIYDNIMIPEKENLFWLSNM